MRHLVIPDVHCKPGISLEHLKWLGRYIVDKQPEKIIQLGDWADMPSLSSYDKGRKAFEGRRYKADIKAARDGNVELLLPTGVYNSQKSSLHKRQYLPIKIKLRGNHEDRIRRAIELSPELEGTLSLNDLRDEVHGWKCCDFLRVLPLDGIHYSHYFTSGAMGYPIGGEYPAATIVKKKYLSCVAGHSHVRDFTERTRADGIKIIGLVAGCYFQHDEAWATPEVNKMWWRGVVMLHGIDGTGYFDPEWISLERIKREYS